MVAGLVAERASEAAAAGVEDVGLETGGLEEATLRRHGPEGFVVAVAVDDGFGGEVAQGVRLVADLIEEVGEEDDLLAEALGGVFVREEVGELVLEHGGAAGLEADDRCAFADVVGEGGEDFAEVGLGLVEHAEVVERTAAAEVLAGDVDAKAGVFEDGEGGLGGVGGEVVVEGVGPEDDVAADGGCVRRFAVFKPLLEALAGEGGHVSLLRDACELFGEGAEKGCLGGEVGEGGDVGP